MSNELLVSQLGGSDGGYGVSVIDPDNPKFSARFAQEVHNNLA
jgi:hypothetical protein